MYNLKPINMIKNRLKYSTDLVDHYSYYCNLLEKKGVLLIQAALGSSQGNKVYLATACLDNDQTIA